VFINFKDQKKKKIFVNCDNPKGKEEKKNFYQCMTVLLANQYFEQIKTKNKNCF
jgi:hypothetical protein